MRTHRLHNCFVLVLVLLLGLPLSTSATGAERAHDPALAGLRVFALDTEGFRPEYRRWGIDAGRLGEQIQGRLHAAGLPLAGRAAALDDPRGALLRLRLKIVPGIYLDTHYYDVALQVVQSQPLPQGQPAAVRKTIWARHIDGHTSELQLKHVTDRALDLIDGFIATYRQQNPAS